MTGMIGRAALHREQPAHRVGDRRVGPEAVDRLGRERHQPTAAQHVDRATRRRPRLTSS